MKSLIISLVLFVSISSSSFAANYSFKESNFKVTAVLKKVTTNPEEKSPAFSFSGRALWTEDDDGNEYPLAQVTIRRTTYNCDHASTGYQDEYRCVLGGATILKILEDVATREESFDAALSLLKNSFDHATYNQTFKLTLGTLNQVGETEDVLEFIDVAGDGDFSVEATVSTTGMKPL